VVIAYSPDLPKDQIKRLQGLFAPPYVDSSFSPIKAIVTPRAKNTKPIELASWTRTLNLDKYDENIIKQFYLKNVGNKDAPESISGSKNIPINEAAQ
jgi:hypothetical protein